MINKNIQSTFIYNTAMDSEVCQRLLQLNNLFYQTFAVQFSATRQRLQPGVLKIIDDLPSPAQILDLGCGNGELARQLAKHVQEGEYIGIDSSAELLEIARQSIKPIHRPEFTVQFHQADLSNPDWDRILGDLKFNVICAFAILHHIPGESLRKQIISRLAARLTPGGVFIHSEWQFLNSPRLRARILPWATIGLSDSQVDAGDYLLDWRSGGEGLRYVHHFSSFELTQLAEQSGFRILNEFNSDGEENRLGLYQIWIPNQR